MPPGLLSSGRRLNGTMAFTAAGKTVTRSRSQKLNTVSRCIEARDFGSPATITRSAAPLRTSDCASWPMAWRELRSPMPISTTPLPIGITSPPSSVAWPWSTSGSPYQTWKSAPANCGWKR